MNITLIGMAGVGKSALGKKLAKKLNYRFIDVDKLIEEEAKLKLQKIIDDFGDKKFVEIEEKVILELGDIDNFVISPGGSVVYSKKAMEFLKKISKVIFLHDKFENIDKRTTNKEKRGIVGLKNKSFKELYNERIKLYEKYADITVDASDLKKALDRILYKLSGCH